MSASKGVAPPVLVENHNASLAQVLPPRQALAVQHERLEKIQNELLERSLVILDGSMRFDEIDADTCHPPQAWIDELGEDGAKRRLRVARGAWMSAKEAPVGIKVASQVAVGILKAKAVEKAAPKVLNVSFVQMTAPVPQFPQKEIEPGT